jgi:hypothetical protein
VPVVDEMSDADLVVLARSSDADGFRVLVSRYRAMAMSVACTCPVTGRPLRI